MRTIKVVPLAPNFDPLRLMKNAFISPLLIVVGLMPRTIKDFIMVLHLSEILLKVAMMKITQPACEEYLWLS